MGVEGGSNTLHSLKGLSLSELGAICRGLAAALGIEMPRIVVDCNNLGYVFSKASSTVASIVNHLMKCANTGVAMEPVCDGDVRPVCKQATNIRVANKEKNRIHAFLLRKEIRKAKQRLIFDKLDQNERAIIQNDITKKEAQLKKKETQASSKLPKNFVSELQRELFESGAASVIPATGGYVADVVVASFQADSYMCSKIINQEAIMAMTRDADIPILCGDCCIAIKGFTKGSFEIVCVSETHMRHAMTFLPTNSKATFTKAKHPIFDGVKDHKLRALFMIILGCDVYIGMKGVGAAKLEQMIKESKAQTEEDLHKHLRNRLKYTNKLTEDVIDTYISAILYEPTNNARDDDNSLPRTYLFGSPIRLPKYLEEFAVDDKYKNEAVFMGPNISRCKGVGDSHHQFLSCEGIQRCFKCGESICSHCVSTIKSDVYCLSCFACESIVSESTTNSTSPSSKTIADMRKELMLDKFDGAKELSADEVEDAYEIMQHINKYRDMADESVPYPLYPTTEMINNTEKWEDLVEIDFKGGGSFLAKPDLKQEYIPGVMKLFAELVRFDPAKKTEWDKDHAVYDSLPDIFIRFAHKSRVDSGFRLLMRCVRHAFDNKTPPLEGNTAMLIAHGGEIGIRLDAFIPASMRQKFYQTGIVVTTLDLLCCMCTCPCGSQTIQRIVCVHTMAGLYQLCLLLFAGLAESIVVEFAACLNADFWDDKKWSANEWSSLKDSAVTLMGAAGEPMDTTNDNSSLSQLLTNFQVGTERRKEWKKRIKTPPKPSQANMLGHD